MSIRETLKPAERKLREAQQLMVKVQKQNEDWPGVGAFGKDITTAKTLLNDMQQNLSDIFVEFTRDRNRHPDSNMEMKVSQEFSKTYSLLSKLHDAVKQVHLCFDNGLSQEDGLIETKKYLEQLINHCLTVRDHLKEISQD